MTGPQKVKLCTWLGSVTERLNGKTDQAIAEQATKVLGFPVALNNISAIRTNPEYGITWQCSKPAGAPKPASRPNKILAREILNIYRHLHSDLGMNFPISNTFVEFFEEATSKPFPDWAKAMRNQALFDGTTTEETAE